MEQLLAPLAFPLACLVVGWARYRATTRDEQPPYPDAFLLVSSLRGRRWPPHLALPALGLYVMLAFAFVEMLRHARFYAGGERDVGTVVEGLKFAAATVALVARRRWSWWLLQLCCVEIIAVSVLLAFPDAPFTLKDVQAIVLGSLLLLYVRRRPTEFGYRAAVPETASVA